MLLIVGQIIRPHGIRGEVVVDVRTDEPEERFAVGSVLVTDPTAARLRPDGRAETAVPERLTVKAARWHKGRLLVAFEGIHDRNQAEALRGVRLCVDSETVPAPSDPEEFHDYQLIGLTVTDLNGNVLGEVERIEHAPASDLLVLRRPDGRRALIPFVKAIVPEVDLAAGRVVVNPPGGLLDL